MMMKMRFGLPSDVATLRNPEKWHHYFIQALCKWGVGGFVHQDGLAEVL